MNREKSVMELSFDSYPENEQFARTAVAAFLMDLNPTLDDLEDVKTAVSEAVTNALIHGYEKLPEGSGRVQLRGEKAGRVVTVEISDQGKGIENIAQAMEPFFTTRPDMDRSGLGFSFMEECMDEVHITSEVGRGTKVTLRKAL